MISKCKMFLPKHLVKYTKQYEKEKIQSIHILQINIAVPN